MISDNKFGIYNEVRILHLLLLWLIEKSENYFENDLEKFMHLVEGRQVRV